MKAPNLTKALFGVDSLRNRPELTDAARVKIIKTVLKECGQPVTPAAINKQFRNETGRDYEVHRTPDPYEAGE